MPKKKKDSILSQVQLYCDDVLRGKVIAGIMEKAAVKRYLSDMEHLNEKGWEFREGAVRKVVDFIHNIKHFTGKHSGKNFNLEPWQLFVIANLYGFYIKDAGIRRFQTAYLEMARKNGKTALVAALSLYHLCADGEDAAEVLFAANSKEQAGIGFRLAQGFTNNIKDYKLRIRWHDIFLDENMSFCRVLAADSGNLDGYNCSFGVVDEYHSAANSSVRDVLQSSMGSRENPLLITITTAGFDKFLPCFALRTLVSDIVSGHKEDDSMFGMVFSMDEGDDWTDPGVWRKANPNLGVTVNEHFLSTQVKKAQNSILEEVPIKTKNFNIWCDAAKVWLPDQYVMAATEDGTFNSGLGDAEMLFCGVDLSVNTDLTAVAFLYVTPDGLYIFSVHYYLPEETLKLRVTAEMDRYKEWCAHGYINVTPGNVTDYNYVVKDMLDINAKCSIQQTYYDKYNSTAWAIACTDAGIPLEPFSQVISNFNSPTKEFERLMLSGKVVIDNNPVTRYCIRNVELRMDVNGNVKPLKDKAAQKIDGVIAMLQALAAYMDYMSDHNGIGIY